jgi:hypothetical protein
MADTSELLGNLTTRRTGLNTNRRRILDQIDALVGGIAERRTAVMLHPQSGWPQVAPQRGAFIIGKPRWAHL